MTRGEAEERARTLQAEDPERDTHRFIARPDSEGGYYRDKQGVEPVDDFIVALPAKRAAKIDALQTPLGLPRFFANRRTGVGRCRSVLV